MKKIILFLLVFAMIFSVTPIIGFTENEVTYAVGDNIVFGSYPQSEVIDEALLDSLNALELNWQSYGYYSGDGTQGSMTQSDYMKYADAEYNGEKYRAVTFLCYRPFWPYLSNAEEESHAYYQKNNNYFINNIYWFKYEPLMWRVLDPVTGLVMCETVIDSQAYCSTVYEKTYEKDGKKIIEYYNDISYTTIATDYESSSIRKWFNDDLFNTAFNSLQQGQINDVSLNRGYDAADKAFLLDVDDVCNLDYGFMVDVDSSYGESYAACDPMRRIKTSDYAKSQGLYTRAEYDNCAAWWTFSTAGDNDIGGVWADGSLNMVTDVNDSSVGVCPAMSVNLQSLNCIHEFTETVTSEAKCTETGNIRFVCDNCGIFFNETIPAINHSMSDWYTDVKSTCTGDGLKKRVCNNICDYYETEIIKATGHFYLSEVTPPTCTEDGYTIYACFCNDVYISDNVPALGHSMGDWITVDKTTYRNCMVCSFEERKIITEGGDVEIEAPEQSNGDFDAEYVDKNDDRYMIVEDSFKNHNNGNYEVVKVFDINLKNNDGIHVQPDGTVKVKLPNDWKHNNYKVYRINDDGTITDMNAYRQGSHIVFETDHFSLYIIVDESESLTETPTEEKTFVDLLKAFFNWVKEMINNIIQLFDCIK